MKPAFLATVAFLSLLPMVQAKSHCIFRVHTEANPRDSEAFASSVKTTVSGKRVAIQKIAAINETDVVSFSAYRAPDGTFSALLRLDDHGRIALDSLSVEHRGGLLFVLVNGRALQEMQIDKRVSDGQFFIPSGLTPADLKLMKKDWKLIEPKKEHR